MVVLNYIKKNLIWTLPTILTFFFCFLTIGLEKRKYEIGYFITLGISLVLFAYLVIYTLVCLLH